MVNQDEVRTLSTVERTCDVIEALQKLEGATVSEVADYLDMSMGGVYNHLATLRKRNYVVKQRDEYRLSLQFFNQGMYARNQRLLYTTGKEETRRLAQKTGEYAHLMAEEFGRGIYIYKSKGENAISEEYEQRKLEYPDYLHLSSTGKAVLAWLPRERVEVIIDCHGLPQANENTITTKEDLFSELETIRERGYALNDQEEIQGTRAIGAPIKTDDRVYGAVSISGPVSRLNESKIDKYAEKVLQVANVISVNISTRATTIDF
ncbi:IclR family transcriptional regulator [Natrarchaeobius oligotrophus]|uniref:IclR family transcriptional regulator n=1 Tax=Natrarchaeobius chitinivorans TaxID=1679083 RepID=A0A3N6P7S0_NATCH|nr:IclR family transcriptional regulator [Natrarchaeobius chitinivorans]RQG94529.1 IclR family transcriptional regulator [Natrarchaeobius chitinivorans]